MLLSDVVEESAPSDPFQTTHVSKIKRLDIVDKINNTNYATNKPVIDEEYYASENQGIGFKRNHNYKWTTVENQFTRKKKRLFEELPELQPTRADVMPLYSSFNAKGIFKPPTSSKD